MLNQIITTVPWKWYREQWRACVCSSHSITVMLGEGSTGELGADIARTRGRQWWKTRHLDYNVHGRCPKLSNQQLFLRPNSQHLSVNWESLCYDFVGEGLPLNKCHSLLKNVLCPLKTLAKIFTKVHGLNISSLLCIKKQIALHVIVLYVVAALLGQIIWYKMLTICRI